MTDQQLIDRWYVANKNTATYMGRRRSGGSGVRDGRRHKYGHIFPALDGRRAPQRESLYHVRDQVLRRDNRTCHICERGGATAIDHLVPWSLGGSDHVSNLRAVHDSCNKRRGYPLPDPFTTFHVASLWRRGCQPPAKFHQRTSTSRPESLDPWGNRGLIGGLKDSPVAPVFR